MGAGKDQGQKNDSMTLARRPEATKVMSWPLPFSTPPQGGKSAFSDGSDLSSFVLSIPQEHPRVLPPGIYNPPLLLTPQCQAHSWRQGVSATTAGGRKDRTAAK